MIIPAKKEHIGSINKIGDSFKPNFSKTYNLEEYLLNDKYIILVSLDEIVNGFMIVLKNYDEYEIEMIVIDKEKRHKGIGKDIMNHFFANYLQKNDIIILEVSALNNNAINFYKEFNFEVINVRKNYYSDSDALIMKRVV